MPKKKTELQKAIGQLISSIQKEWGDEAGEGNSNFTETIMDLAHDLLQAGDREGVLKVLGPLNVRQYFGEVWLKSHPRVMEKVLRVEEILN